MLDSRTIEALNALLEGERASVEVEVALADGATELYERDAFTQIALVDVTACCSLRERLDETGMEVSRKISAAALHILGSETYDVRLLAFADHQEAMRERALALLEATTDRETRQALQDIADAHAGFVPWCVEHAREFANSRTYDFTRRSPDGRHALAPTATGAEATGSALPNAALGDGPEGAVSERERTRGDPGAAPPEDTEPRWDAT
jgi:hypothetical protein